MKECPPSNESYGFGIEFMDGLGYGHTGSHIGYLTVAFYDPVTDCMVISECTLYPDDTNLTLNSSLGSAVVGLIKKMKQTLGY